MPFLVSLVVSASPSVDVSSVASILWGICFPDSKSAGSGFDSSLACFFLYPRRWPGMRLSLSKRMDFEGKGR